MTQQEVNIRVHQLRADIMDKDRDVSFEGAFVRAALQLLLIMAQRMEAAGMPDPLCRDMARWQKGLGS